MALKEITTSDGFKCTINPELKDDFEFVEAMADAQRGDLAAYFDVLDKLLGDQLKDLKEFVRNEEGIVKSDDIRREVEEIFAQLDESKN